MADPVLKPLVDRGLPSSLQQLQTVGDGLSDPGSGISGGQAGAVDSSTSGGQTSDENFNRFPDPMRSLLNRARAEPDTQIR